MGLALLFEAGFAIFQKFGLGNISAGGSFGHQNSLGLMSHFVIFPTFALLLAGQPGWNVYLVPAAGSILAVATTSRATLVLAAGGYALTFLLSALRGWTRRKSVVSALAASAIVVLAPISIASFEKRFTAQGHEGVDFYTDDERVNLAKAASSMLSDYPMGVGANNFVVTANSGQYYTRAGVSWTSFSATVHNVYWLVAVETGYAGFVAFVLILFRPLFVAFSCGWRCRGDWRGDLLLGLGVSLFVVYLHSMYEWIFITFQIQYLFGVTVGLVAGLAQQLGYWKKGSTFVGRRP